MRWRWWGYWFLFVVFHCLARAALNVQEWAIMRAIQYATSCYVTGGPQSMRDFLDEILPPKIAES